MDTGSTWRRWRSSPKGSTQGITLSCARDDLANLDPFLQTVRVEDQGVGLSNVQGLAYAEFQRGLSATDFSMTGGGTAYVDEEAIPANELATRHHGAV